jgi:hypothetical protein
MADVLARARLPRMIRIFRMVILAATAIAIPTIAAPLEQSLYISRNLWVDKNIDDLDVLFRRAAKAGYTHVLLADSKFAKLDDMDARYFRNIDRVKALAGKLGLEIVPAVFPIGCSNDILWHDPNLIEALPVRDAPFVVIKGEARLQTKLPLKGGDFADLKQWNWHDRTVTADAGAARVTNLRGQTARIVQTLNLTPFRQYHLSLRVRTDNLRGTPEVKVLVGNHALNYNPLGVKSTQDWTTHHVTFNSLDHTNVNLYIGCWGGQSGSLWFDDAQVDEVGLLNVVRRDGAPLSVTREDGPPLVEGRDFERLVDPHMGNKPWKGAYDVWHEPPALKTKLPDGTKLRVSYYHGVTVHEDQAMICPSEPRTVELLRDQARRMHAAWGAKGYMMSHDEIRVLNWCAACQGRRMDAGAILADNARTCISILREVNPGGRIYAWSDMFDPHHNAKTDYYLVRGDLRGSWEGLDKDVIIVPWYFEKRAESLRWFAERKHREVIAGYYDEQPSQIVDWLKSGEKVNGVIGVMYTTWRSQYADLEAFAEEVRRFQKR